MDDETLAMAVMAFQEAVAIAGSQSEFARRTGARQQTISNLLRRGAVLTAELVRPAERETGVSRFRLRPDLYPTEQLDSPSCMSIGSVATGGAVENFDRAALLKRDAGNA